MKEYLLIIVGAVLVNNFVLTRFLGVCPFLGVSKQLSSAVGMSAAVTFVLVFATAVTYPLYWGLLEPLGIAYLDTMVFIVIIALLVQMVEMIMKKYVPPLYRALGVYLPLITTNCAVLGAALINVDGTYSYTQALVHSFGAGIGFFVAIFLFAGVRRRIEHSDIPEAFKGAPATLIAASITALSFTGFGGIVG